MSTKLKNTELQVLCKSIGAASSGTKQAMVGAIASQRQLLLDSSKNPRNTVLSVDLGLKNIGICALSLKHDRKPEVSAWNLFNLDNPPLAYPAFAHAATQFAHKLMTCTPKGLEPTTILIEKQRSRSAGAAAVPHSILRINILEGMLHAVLACNYPHVHIASIDPKIVLAYWRQALLLPKTSTYRESKNQRLALVSKWLASPETAPFTLDPSIEIRKSGKRDDLNDSLTQAITWIQWIENSQKMGV